MTNIAVTENRILTIGENEVLTLPNITPAPFPALWLRADALDLDADEPVTEFTDMSGNGYHAIQTTQANKPIFKAAIPALNNKPTIQFNRASSQFFFNTNAPTGQLTTFSFFIVFNAYEYFQYRWIYKNTPWNVGASFSLSGHSLSRLGYWNNGGVRIVTISVNQMENVYYLVEVHYDSARPSSKARFLINSFESGSDNQLITTSNILGFSIGKFAAANNFDFNGEIAEIILFSNEIPDEGKTYIRNYISQKYGIF